MNNNTGTPAFAHATPKTSARALMQRLWDSLRPQGVGAVIAAYAEAAATGQVEWRRPGHARDPMAHAQAVFASGCREGWLRTA